MRDKLSNHEPPVRSPRLEKFFALADDLKNRSDEYLHDLLDAPTAAERYVRGTCEFHVHLWIEAGESDLRREDVCARFQRADSLTPSPSKLHIGDGPNNEHAGGVISHKWADERPVFVLVRQVSETGQRVSEGELSVPSGVRLIPLNECPHVRTDSDLGSLKSPSPLDLHWIVDYGELAVVPSEGSHKGEVIKGGAEIVKDVPYNRPPSRGDIGDGDYKEVILASIHIELSPDTQTFRLTPDLTIQSFEMLCCPVDLGPGTFK